MSSRASEKRVVVLPTGRGACGTKCVNTPSLTARRGLRYSAAARSDSEPNISRRHSLIAALLLSLAGAAGWAGCGAGIAGGSGGAAAPSTAGAVQVDVIVPKQPPPDKTDPAKPAAPGFGYIWVAGHWDWVEGIYLWKEGRWMQGRAGYEYVRARYDFDGGQRQWIYRRPHWKRRLLGQATPQAAPAPTPPPEPPAVVPSPSLDGGTPQVG